MTPSRIVLDADHGKVDAAANNTAKRYRKVADEAGLIGKRVDAIGTQFIGKAAGLSAILGAMRAINQEAKKISDASVSSSERSGDRVLKTGAAIRSLGLDKGADTSTDILKQISDMVGPRSTDELSDFLVNVAQQKGMTGKSAMRRLKLFATGVVTDREAMDADANLGRIESDIPSRTNRLSVFEEKELAARSLINRADMQRANREQVGGLGMRVGRAEQELAQSGRSLATRIGIAAADTVTLGTVSNGRDSNAASGVERRLDKLIELNRTTVKPTMATTPEGGP